MKFAARGRVKSWTHDFARWAQSASKEHDEVDDHSSYYLGVIAGIADARRHAQQDLNVLEVEMGQGYVDARVLINKVLELGDAPEGDFYELLGLPYSAPLHARNG